MTPEKQRALADVLALIRARQVNELTADERTLALAAVEARAALDEARRERDALRKAAREVLDAYGDDEDLNARLRLRALLASEPGA